MRGTRTVLASGFSYARLDHRFVCAQCRRRMFGKAKWADGARPALVLSHRSREQRPPMLVLAGGERPRPKNVTANGAGFVRRNGASDAGFSRVSFRNILSGECSSRDGANPLAQRAEIAGADFLCSACTPAKTGDANATARHGVCRCIRQHSARQADRSSGNCPEPPCPERGPQRNVGPSRKGAASAASTSPPRATGAGNCSRRSHLCSANDHVRSARDCRPCAALRRPPPAARGCQFSPAAMGARGRPQCADTAHSRGGAAAVRRETACAYAHQAA